MNETKPHSKRRKNQPLLRFSPTAWAKLLYLRDQGDTEVGGFGITAADDLLLVEDLQLVRQSCTCVSVEFDDESVADFIDRQVDVGNHPQQCLRIWIHTHPANSAQPSQTDEQTFARVFGRSDWSVMFILAQGGESYARLQLDRGLRATLELEVEIDYSQPFAASDWEAWEAEYMQNVVPEVAATGPFWWDEDFGRIAQSPEAWRRAWHEYSDEEFQETFADE